MSKRKKLTRKGSKRLFRATANKTHPKNLISTVNRGGFRL